jgi:ABC-type glycerol-3-phosphate transport system substrate-binding protein
MKMFRILALALCATFMLTACGGGSPESVAKSFVKAFVDRDFSKAAEYATAKTASWLAEAAKTSGQMDLREYDRGTEISLISSEVKEGKATVTLELRSPNGDKVEAELELVKEDGSWKVELEYRY